MSDTPLYVANLPGIHSRLFGASAHESTETLAVYGVAAPVGGAAGVFLGGVITEYISWPWVFYIDVPIAILALIADSGTDAERARTIRIGLLGAITVTSGLAAAVNGIIRAPEVGVGIGTDLGSARRGGRTLAGFVYVQTRRSEPLMRLRIFRAPNLAAASVAQLLLGAAWVPIWFS